MSTRLAVLAALRFAGERGVSGESLAGELGVSRVAVGKHVKALREEGYTIDAKPGTGYVLGEIPDAPLPAEVALALSSGMFCSLLGGGETGSTNDDARALARSGAAEGTVVLASAQNAGRGRLGRTWDSPKGGAYFSAVLRPGVAPAQVSALALVVGVGIARGLASLGADVRLKWPNDVMLSGGKVAGVLLEMTAEADAVDWVVAGVGVNVTRGDVATHVSQRAVYLSDVVPGVRIANSVAAVLDGVADTYAAWLSSGFAALRAEYDERSSLTGVEVTVSNRGGTPHASGVVLGVDDEGRLLLATSDGIQPVASGEVTLRPPRAR